MAKIYLDPGHGGNDPGAVGNGLKEKDVTLKIARYTRDHLNDNYTGHSIRMSRNSDKTVSLAARTNDANKWRADSYTSIHINSATSSATGYEDFIYNGPVSQNTHNLRNAVHSEMLKVFKGFRNRGKKRANFHVLREAHASAVLPEFLFISNKDDAAFLKKDSNLKLIGKHLAIALAKHHKLKAKKVSSGGGSNSGGLYYVQIGAFGKKTNADSLVARAKRAGFPEAYAKKEGSTYKVQLGAFGSKKNADALASRAKRAGFDVYIAR